MALANDVDVMLGNSGALDLSGIDWEEVPKHPLREDEIRVLTYFMDVEANTIVYLKELLSTEAIHEPKIQAFLSCWAYEEFFHGHAIRRFLQAYGVPLSEARVAQQQQQRGLLSRARLWAQNLVAWACGPRFIGVHMAWGAANELATAEGYLQLIRKTQHPILAELLKRIQKDERRHFAFYYKEAAERMADPKTSTLVNALIRRFFEPVGADIRSLEEVDMVACYLFADREGLEVVRSVDRKMAQLPGMEGFDGLERVMRRTLARHAMPWPA